MLFTEVNVEMPATLFGCSYTRAPTMSDCETELPAQTTSTSMTMPPS